MTRSVDTRPPVITSSLDAVRGLLGRGSIYTLGLAIQMSAALLVVPVVTRLLTPAQFGEVAAGLVVMAIVSLAAAAGLPEAGSRAFFSEADGPRHARQLALATIGLAIAAGAVADLTGPLWAPVFGTGYTWTLRIAVWAGAITAMMLAAQAILRTADRPWSFLAVSATASLGAQAAGLVGTAIFRSPTGYMAGSRWAPRSRPPWRSRSPGRRTTVCPERRGCAARSASACRWCRTTWPASCLPRPTGWPSPQCSVWRPRGATRWPTPPGTSAWR